MPRFSANLSMLFQEYPFLERFGAAARAGFRAVELQFPYAWPAEELAYAAREAGVETVLFNFPAGDWAGGERGLGCLPGRAAEFRAGVARAIDYARTLGCPRLNVLAGIAPAEETAERLRATLVGNLRHAADACAPHGIAVLLEAINTHDVPGFFVDRSAHAIRLIDAAARGNLFIQYDLYHAHAMRENLSRTLARLLPRIGHIQFADHPGRGEPGTGTIDFPRLFACLDRLGYTGWTGAEYRPQGADTETGLGWLRAG